MIGFLKGKIHSKEDGRLVVDVSGVGYEVVMAKSALLAIGRVGEPITLEVYTHVNETQFQLFGFLNSKEKTLFKKLIAVSGIGPKLGLTIVASIQEKALVTAIIESDAKSLMQINGVGKKMAERMVIELKDKFKDFDLELSLEDGDSLKKEVQLDPRIKDAVSALISLGYQEYSARKVLKDISIANEDNVQSLIKKSLGRLA